MIQSKTRHGSTRAPVRLAACLAASTCLTSLSGVARAAEQPAAAPTASSAQPPAALAEVVVTARKKQELLLDVPLAVTAVTSQTIQRANLRDFNDVAKLSPGFFNAPVSSGRADRAVNNFIIRGLNLTSFTGAADAVLLFVDGAPVVSGDLSGFDDIERIEVLRGPQSAYFGRNAFAGAINVVTKDPSFEWGGQLTAEWADHNTSAVSGAIEGPLVADKLAFRLSGRYRDQGGFYDNPAGGVLGERKTKGVSLTLLAKPTSKLRIKTYLDYSKFDDGPAATGKLSGSYLTCPQPGQNWICGDVGNFPDNLAGANNAIYPEFQTNIIDKYSMFNHPFIKSGEGLATRNWSAHAIATYDLPGGMTFNSTTAYHKSQTEVVSDEDQQDTRSIPNPFYGKAANVQPFYNLLFFVERRFTDFSQEFRLTSNQGGRLRWATGFNYVYVNAISSNVAGEAPFFAGFFSNTGLVKVKTPSVFGALYYDLTDKLTLSAEARYQWDDVRVFPSSTVNVGKTFKSFSPRLTIQYKPDSTTNIFADWARGYRPGTFNARFLTLPASEVQQLVAQTGAGVAVNQEQLDMAELGIKKRFLDNRASVSLVGYYGVLKNQQVQNLTTYINEAGNPIAIAVITNVGKTNLYGVEFEGALAVNRNLTAHATWAYNETNIRSYYCVICSSITGTPYVTGNHLPGVPRFTGSLYAEYIHPLAGDYDWFFRPEYYYTGSSFATEANLASTGARNEVNLRGGVENGTLRFEAYVTNLFNDKTPLAIARGVDPFNLTKGAISVGLPPLREFGARVSYKF